MTPTIADRVRLIIQEHLGKDEAPDVAHLFDDLGADNLDDAEAFVPPPGVTRLVYVMDGDSDPASTKAKMLTGLRRAMARHPGLRGQIAAEQAHLWPGAEIAAECECGLSGPCMWDQCKHPFHRPKGPTND